jgi:4-hydroxy-2-oxoheptanedioate aldolase
MGLSFGHLDRHDPPYPQDMIDARARVKAACDQNKVAFLNAARPENVVEMIEEGVKVLAARREAAEIGRKHTGRTS